MIARASYLVNSFITTFIDLFFPIDLPTTDLCFVYDNPML